MIYEFDSILGIIYIEADSEKLISVSYFKPEGQYGENKIIKETSKQLKEYFSGSRKIFNLPFCLSGSKFQKSVYEELLKIPYGELKSYKDIAKAINNENASRAVGNANNKNPLAIIVPCHRVIGSDSNLTGYAGGLEKKFFLITLEKYFSNNIV